MSSTTDVSVRPAIAGDEEAITSIQLAAWTELETIGPGVVTLMDEDAIRAAWRSAIMTPPGPAYRVVVACSGPAVVGFTAVAPDRTSDDAGEIIALEVHPSARRSGHGSRLLAAAVDHLRDRGLSTVSVWVLHDDEARVRFLSEAGLGPDGTRRNLTAHEDPRTGSVLTESRWSASI